LKPEPPPPLPKTMKANHPATKFNNSEYQKQYYSRNRTASEKVAHVLITYVIKQTTEKQREFNLETHIAFVDLGKAFDRVHRNQVWQILNRRGIPYHLIEVIKSLYKSTSIQIDTGRKILEKIYINEGVRQGCNLSPALFNIYIDNHLRNWKHKADTGILLKRNLYLNTLLFADDQVIIQDTEDKLQKPVHILHQISKDYNLKISTTKTKVMVFKGKHLVRSKIEIDGSILEQVKQFNYFGRELSLDGKPDIDKKINRFQGVCATIRKYLKKKVHKVK
jgi:hypothetical protein